MGALAIGKQSFASAVLSTKRVAQLDATYICLPSVNIGAMAE